MNMRQGRRLERLRRSDARLNAHPWLYAAPVSIVIIVVPAIARAAEGRSLATGFMPDIVGAAVALVLFRWYGPRITRKRLAQLARRYGETGPSRVS
jgi:hypothetical protein